MSAFQGTQGGGGCRPWGLRKRITKDILMNVHLELQSLESTGFPESKLKTNSRWQGDICLGRGLWGIKPTTYGASSVRAPGALHTRPC